MAEIVGRWIPAEPSGRYGRIRANIPNDGQTHTVVAPTCQSIEGIVAEAGDDNFFYWTVEEREWEEGQHLQAVLKGLAGRRVRLTIEALPN
jgi:hypothetical protein